MPSNPPPTDEAALEAATAAANYLPEDDNVTDSDDSNDNDSGTDPASDITSETLDETNPDLQQPSDDPAEDADDPDSGTIDEVLESEIERIYPKPSSQNTARRPRTIREVHDPDARTAGKTAKNGKSEWVYGYHVHTAVPVPGRRKRDDEPRIVSRFRLTPANLDVVDVTLELLDTLDPLVTDIIVDRHYHYKSPERWRDQLSARGIKQHFDLRSDEQGFTEHDRMRWAAGWPHCPSTPDSLGSIPRPGFAASKKEIEAFDRLIQERMRYAMQRLDRPDIAGTARWSCPALNGTIGCELRPGTIASASEFGIPAVENPPDPNGAEGLPRCCSKAQPISTPTSGIRKLMQDEYWGSTPWDKWRKQRTYVEGLYGNVKSADSENLHRGQHRLVGLPHVTIIIGLVFCAYNMRTLRRWHETSDQQYPDHPLFEETVIPTYVLEVTENELSAIADPARPNTALDELRNKINQAPETPTRKTPRKNAKSTKRDITDTPSNPTSEA
jgi:hypothetical protein